MEPSTFAELEHDSKKRRTRREVFLERMDALLPWNRPEARVEPFYPKAGRGRRPSAGGGLRNWRSGRNEARNLTSAARVAVPRTSFRFLRAARPCRFGLRGAVVACPVLLAVCVSMPLAHAYPGSARDMTVTARAALMDASWTAATPSSAVTVAERESAGRKPAPVLADASTGAARSPRTGVRPPAGWRVQLGAFRSKSGAEKARTTLSQTLAGLPRVRTLVIDDSKDDGLFRVILADAFAHRGEAAATCAAIAARGAQCFVVRAPASHPVLERLDRLEAQNAQLRKEVEALKAERTKPVGVPPSRTDPGVETTTGRLVRTDSKFGYDILDPTTGINRKQRLMLERRNDGTLAPDSLHVHGAVTAIANYQSSNRNDKFGYLMRHPTAKNQVGDTVSEATIHSAQFGFTGTLGDWLTGHAAMLFDPEQSFGDGTNTDIDRNQLQMRRAYVLFGNLDRSPFYASLGKMAVPFGLTDTVNPFSASTVWHVFGGLANGVTAGYANDGLNLSVMGIQGGAQFRAANTPVKGTAVPGRLNNFAADASYRFGLGQAATLLLGGSYQHGTALCQGFPITHFGACEENNPAFDLYGRLVYDDLTFKGEFARTTEVWPGTFNPGMPQFAASKVTSFDIGARYRHGTVAGPVDLSAEFSRLVAGPDGAPWERRTSSSWVPHGSPGPMRSCSPSTFMSRALRP